MSQFPEERETSATVFVNGQPKTVTKKELSFEDVVALAYNGSPPSGPNWVFTVSYSKGEDKKPRGSMQPDDTVKVKDGMVFNVTATDKS